MINTNIGNIVRDTTTIATSTTLNFSNLGDMINVNSANQVTLTIPADSLYPIGSTIQVNRLGAGDVFVQTVSPHSIISANGFKLDGQNSVGYLTKIDSSTWSFYGATATGGTGVGFLLDGYSGSNAAYSLRKINSSHTGFVLRVRAGTTNAEADVAFDTNNTVSANSIVTVTASESSGLTIGEQVTFSAFWNAGQSDQNVFVTRWYNQSGGSVNLIKTIASAQPLIVVAGVIQTFNSLPVISFTGTTDNLQMSGAYTSLSATGNFTIVAVVKNNSVNPDGFILNVANNPLNRVTLSALGIFTLNIDGTLIGMQRGTNTSQNSLFFATLSPQQLFINNNPGNSGGVLNAFNNPTLSVGGRNDNSTNANANLLFSELILYPSNQVTNRTAIEQNINAYYQIY